MNKQLKITISINFFIAAFFLFSCQQIKDKYFGVNEGMITYEVKFPNLKPNTLAASMMPNEVQTYFKDGKLRVEMNIAYGLIKTISISDPKKEQEAILLDLFGKKYLFMNDAASAAQENKIPYQFEKLNEKKDIAGLQCNRVLVINPKNKKSFSVFYTTQIKGKHTNWHTPYGEIDGMLLQYPITRHNIDMELMAANIERKSVNDSLFKIPDGFEKVSKERFEKILSELMTTGGMGGGQ